MARLWSGNEAIARGAYEAGVSVATAYPGTPSTEILENISRYRDAIYCQWAPNEKVALEVAVGASLGGARTLVGMKHVGLNVAADPFLTFAYTGVKGGTVVVTADDPGMHSSQNEQDNRHYARLAKVPLLEPSDSQEAKEFVIRALEISEEYDTPVILRSTTRISHSKTVVYPAKRVEVEGEGVKEFEKIPEKYVMVPAHARKRRAAVEKRIKILEQLAENIDLNLIEWNSRKIGVVTSGISYQYVKEALPDASVLKLGFSYPVPQQKIREFASQVERLYVVEELDAFLEEYIRAMKLDVTGKEKLPALYELNQSILREKLLDEKLEPDDALEVALPRRPPILCPGCPHRGILYVLSKLKLVVMGDIGCYTLGVGPPLASIDSCVCMGAGVSMTFGVELAMKENIKNKMVGVIGDSTFVHSGITCLIDIVYNRGASTIIILDNRTTGMTGHQDHPGTGKTLMGEETTRLDLEKLCKAIGVEEVPLVDPYDLESVEAVVKAETAKDKPSVIVARRACVLIDSDSRGEPLFVDKESCNDCGRCYKVGCPAVYKEDNAARIDESMCTGCGICLQVCKFNAIKKAGAGNEH